jgi:hypothetical protein
VTTLLAHQGGWDEILLVVAPMVVVGGLLWIAKRRVDRQALSRRSDAGASDAGASDEASDALDAGTDRSEASN